MASLSVGLKARGAKLFAEGLRDIATGLEKIDAAGVEVEVTTTTEGATAAPEQPAPAPKAPKAAKPPKCSGDAPAPAPAAKTGPTVDDVRTGVQSLIKARGREAALELLGKFGVQKVSDLKPEHFQAAIDECGP
jgi:hypothetical protein